MADRRACGETEAHEMHGWVDGDLLSPRFHVCPGVPDPDAEADEVRAAGWSNL